MKSIIILKLIEPEFIILKVINDTEIKKLFIYDKFLIQEYNYNLSE